MKNTAASNAIQLQLLIERHRQLYIDIYINKEMMLNLGGVMSKEEANNSFNKCIKSQNEYNLNFVIFSSDLNKEVGTAGFWECDFEGKHYIEVGWMVLPQYQRKGFAFGAATELLKIIKSKNHKRAIVAFTEIKNPASDKICKKLGFKFIKPVTRIYGTRIIECHQWVLG